MHNTPEPIWQPITQLPISLEDEIRGWLTEDVSLTARLQTLGIFEVEVINEGWGLASPSEETLLSLEKNEKIWFRDVVLKVNGKPWVVGHTIIPSATLKKIPDLQILGKHSLGDLIFKKLQGSREKLEFTFLFPEHALFKLTESKCRTKVKKYYARRSLICVQSQELLINEAFIFGD